ncbi:MAG: hypothetical protein OEM60_01785 [Gammaproteobacteria bacterium]|nr:hypothetical protein [Gammaproteobacteria bacterium]MDH3430789.1 hypothetical protein [Gammaproteobacteria bacterium]MDH3432565.1 hypothetical protein [Gammaproteobacteria bacterium]
MNIRNALLGLLSLAGMLSGCSTVVHNYAWAAYPVDPVLVRTDAAALHGKKVAVSYRDNDSASVMIGQINNHQYFGSNEQLAEAVSIQLSDELRRLGMSISAGGSKTLNLRVSHPTTEQGAWVVRAHMRIMVETGDGYVFEKAISNATPGTIPRAFNGAVNLAVVDILNDARIAAYLGAD